jgi:hypothetical protein
LVLLQERQKSRASFKFRICSLFLTSGGLFLRRSNYVRVSSDVTFSVGLLPNLSLYFFTETFVQICNPTSVFEVLFSLFPWAPVASHGCTTAQLAFCTARFRRSNFGHQMPPRLPTRSALQRRKLEIMGGVMGPVILPKCRLPRYILGIFYMPQICDMGPTALLPFRRRIFPPLKIRRLRSGLNPRTWVPEASMLTPRPPKPLVFDVTLCDSNCG